MPAKGAHTRHTGLCSRWSSCRALQRARESKALSQLLLFMLKICPLSGCLASFPCPPSGCPAWHLHSHPDPQGHARFGLCFQTSQNLNPKVGATGGLTTCASFLMPLLAQPTDSIHMKLPWTRVLSACSGLPSTGQPPCTASWQGSQRSYPRLLAEAAWEARERPSESAPFSTTQHGSLSEGPAPGQLLMG